MMNRNYNIIRPGLVAGLFLLSFLPPDLTGQVYAWAKDFGGTGHAEGRSISQDTAGNIYVLGRFFMTVDFDPGPGTMNLSSNANSYDVFLAKLDPNGDLTWVQQFAGADMDFSSNLVIDGAGDIVFVGSYHTSIDMDPGAGTYTLTSSGNADFFVCKVSSAGNLVWARSCGGAGSDYAYGVALDAGGNVLVTGGFSGTADFNPGAGVFNLSANGSEDAFVVKLDPNGGFLWAANSNVAGSDNSTGICTDPSGNVYSGGNSITKFNSSGTLVWTRTCTGAKAAEVVLDQAGNLYAGGLFSGTTDFDPGAGTVNVTAIGASDAYIQKLDANGDLLWVRTAGSVSSDVGIDLALDSAGSPHLAGTFSGNTDFDPGSGTFYLAPVGSAATFIWKLTVTGDFEWAVTVSGSGHNNPESIFINSASEVFTTGKFVNTTDFDPSAAVANLTTSTAYFDAYAWKLAPCMAPDMVIATAGDSAICAGDTVMLTVSGNLNDASGWSWYSGSCGATSAGSGTGIQVAPSATTTYYVRGEGGCVTSASCSAVTIVVNPLPVVTLNLSAQDTQCVTSGAVVLSGYSPAGGTMTGNTISGTTFYPDSAGIGTFGITYTYTDTNGCIASATDSIYVDVCTGMETHAADGLLLAYPNPVSGMLTIATAGEPIGEIAIYPVTGKMVFTPYCSTSQTVIDMSSFAPGIYLLRVGAGANAVSKRILKAE